MDKSSKGNYSNTEQVEAWNIWNEEIRGNWTGDSKKNISSTRQMEFVESAISDLGRKDLSIIEVGCGSGWLCDRLTQFGKVVGTDLADGVLQKSAEKWPRVKFVSGNFFDLDFPLSSFDVVVTLEVLSHIEDQQAFIDRLAALLKPGGMLILATQNRPVLERWSAIGGPTHGQIRHWVNAKELSRMMKNSFSSYQLSSIFPVGDEGFLRIVNSTKLNALFGVVFSKKALERVKEKQMLGQTLIVKAIK